MSPSKQTKNVPPPVQLKHLLTLTHPAPVKQLCWSADGASLISTDAQSTVTVWNATTGVARFSCNAPGEQVTALACSPDGTCIAIADDAGPIFLCDATSGHLLLAYHLHEGSPCALAWSPDSTMIVSTDRDTVHLWQANDPPEICWTTPDGFYETWPVAWSPDGTIIAISDETAVIVLDAIKRDQLRVYEHHCELISAIAFSPDGRRLATASDMLDIRIWEPLMGITRRIIRTHEIGMIVSLSWSADGALLAATGDQGVRVF